MGQTVTVYLIRHRGNGKWFGEKPNSWYSAWVNAKLFIEEQEARRFSKTRQICRGVADVVSIQVSLPDLPDPTGELAESGSVVGGDDVSDDTPAKTSRKSRRAA